jgi:two-component system sensor histidine kinase RegB
VRDEGLLAVATLAAGAAHAINTPLATLSVVLSDLRDGMAGMDAAALQEDVALMSAQVEACRAAVGQLISDARSESGPLAAGRLDDRLHAAVERWRLLRPGFDARLEFSDDAGDIALAADRSFDYLVLNLLDNAADASRSAGSDGVVLRVSREPAFLRMTFLDQGPGLAGTPSPLRSDKPGGLGLGFALATRVCEQFDGALQPVSGGVLARLSLARLAAAA